MRSHDAASRAADRPRTFRRLSALRATKKLRAWRTAAGGVLLVALVTLVPPWCAQTPLRHYYSSLDLDSPAKQYTRRHGTMHLTYIRPGVTKHTPTDPTSFKRAMELLKGVGHDADEFRRAMTAALSNSSFDAFFFECPPVHASTFDTQSFAFVLVDAPTLVDVPADTRAFEQYTKQLQGTSKAVTFPNLGGDAVLVAPVMSEGVPADTYSHFARFIRAAPLEQITNFWKLVGQDMVAEVETSAATPIWLSTSGLGVYYLHMRMDSTPKYYTYAPYKHFVPASAN